MSVYNYGIQEKIPECHNNISHQKLWGKKIVIKLMEKIDTFNIKTMHHQRQSTSVNKMTTENNNISIKISKIKKMTTILKIITIVTTTQTKF